jgi:hypothetical protein
MMSVNRIEPRKKKRAESKFATAGEPAVDGRKPGMVVSCSRVHMHWHGGLSCAHNETFETYRLIDLAGA